MNSRNLCSYGWKRPLQADNNSEVMQFIADIQKYLLSITLPGDNLPVVRSRRKTGFIGFLVCCKSIEVINEMLLTSPKPVLEYLLTYRMSQDHIELFFSKIRSMGGFNNNPSARQFLAAYKRVLTHCEIQEVTRGNCVPLESVTILSASSHYLEAPNASVPSSSVINRSLHKSRVLEADVTNENKESEVDSESLASACVLSPYSDKIVGYIAGFVSLKLKRSLKCESCCNALFNQHLDATHGLISVKNKGHLSFPSRDVVAICLVCERKFREKVLLYSDQPYAKLSTHA